MKYHFNFDRNQELGCGFSYYFSSELKIYRKHVQNTYLRRTPH